MPQKLIPILVLSLRFDSTRWLLAGVGLGVFLIFGGMVSYNWPNNMTIIFLSQDPLVVAREQLAENLLWSRRVHLVVLLILTYTVCHLLRHLETCWVSWEHEFNLEMCAFSLCTFCPWSLKRENYTDFHILLPLFHYLLSSETVAPDLERNILNRWASTNTRSLGSFANPTSKQQL